MRAPRSRADQDLSESVVNQPITRSVRSQSKLCRVARILHAAFVHADGDRPGTLAGFLRAAAARRELQLPRTFRSLLTRMAISIRSLRKGLCFFVLSACSSGAED